MRLSLLGGFELRSSDGAVCSLPSMKARALLAYMALHPTEPLSRERLAALLWGDAPAGAARASLRQCLRVLRRTVADGSCVSSWGTSLCLDPQRLATDVDRFERCCDRSAPQGLEAAIDLYRGDFLDGFDIDEEPFDEWLLGERYRLRERLAQASSRLLMYYERHARTADAIRVGMKLLTFDPLQERVHRSLMRCFEREGRKRRALRQFELCRDTLRRELDVEPTSETRQLYRRLLGVPLELNGAPTLEQRLADGCSVAVRPLVDLSDEPLRGRFGHGLSEDIATELARIPDLVVIGDTQEHGRLAIGARETEPPGARFVLEGSVRRAGRRLRINVHLLDTVSRAHVWARRYDRDASDILAVQDEVARTVADAVVTQLNGD